MVLAYHLIVSCYGFWLPNDERGSWSDFVRSYELARLGEATKVTTRRSLAKRGFDRARREAMRMALKRRPVRWTGEQAKAVVDGFADYSRRTGCVVHACAILPDHAHLVVARHRVKIERVCEQLKGAATMQLNRKGLHPFADQSYSNGRLPTPWARKGWWVFLDSARDIERAVDYTNTNPVRDGLKAQRWKFVTPYVESAAARRPLNSRCDV